MNELVKIENNEIVIPKEVTDKIIKFENLKKEIEYQEKILKAGLMECLNILGKKNYTGNGISATIRSGSTKTILDTKRLKAECPEIWETYSTTSETSPSLILTVSN